VLRVFVCLSGSCLDIYTISGGTAVSGVYTLDVAGPDVVVYCDFDSAPGCVFTYISPSTTSIDDITSLYTENDIVVLRHLRQKGKQYTADVRQITAFDGVPLSVQFNANTGYVGPINGQMGPYIHLGIVPTALIKPVPPGPATTQGWSIQGTDAAYLDCDGNPSSYFVLLLNENNEPCRTTPAGDVLAQTVESAWVTGAVDATVEIPNNFFVEDYELHFGCGALLYSTYEFGGGIGRIRGVAFGLKSNLPV